MSNVIDFLERMGQDAQMRHASAEDVAQALEAAQIDPQLSAAILAKDQPLVDSILGGSNVYCALMPGKEDEEEEEQEDDEQAPSREALEISLHARLSSVASAG